MPGQLIVGILIRPVADDVGGAQDLVAGAGAQGGSLRGDPDVVTAEGGAGHVGIDAVEVAQVPVDAIYGARILKLQDALGDIWVVPQDLDAATITVIPPRYRNGPAGRN